MFIEIEFAGANVRNQPKCLPTDERVKIIWCIYYGILLRHKNNEMLTFG